MVHAAEGSVVKGSSQQVGPVALMSMKGPHSQKQDN